MDIKASYDYPAGELSNFSRHPFELDGIKCASMEGFLQSLLVDNLELQIEVCQMVGIEAKRWGLAHIDALKPIQKLWWRGREHDRHGVEYQELLDRAYEALFQQNENFREALRATGDEVLTHSIAINDPHEDILSEKEFCSRLMKLRSMLNS